MKIKPVRRGVNSRIALLCGSLLLCALSSFAQSYDDHAIYLTLPEVALVDIEPDLQTVVLNLNTVTEAGAPITSVSDNSKWINYSSAIGGGGAYRDVTVQLQGGEVPPGLQLALNVGPAVGGDGALGQIGGGFVTLSGSPVYVIKQIRGAYTGDGANHGHQLTYRLKITNLQTVSVGSTNLSVLYTLVDM